MPRLALYVATRAAASSKSLIVLAEALIRDLKYDHSQSFSDMVSNTDIAFLPRFEIVIRRLYTRLLPNSEDACFGGGLWLLGMGLIMGRHLRTNRFIPISNVSFTSIFTLSVSNKHEPLHHTLVWGHEVWRVTSRDTRECHL
jgi:hypothetical protein